MSAPPIIIYSEPLAIASKVDQKHSVSDNRTTESDIKRWHDLHESNREMAEALGVLQKRIDKVEEYVNLHLSKKFTTTKNNIQLPNL